MFMTFIKHAFCLHVHLSEVVVIIGSLGLYLGDNNYDYVYFKGLPTTENCEI